MALAADVLIKLMLKGHCICVHGLRGNKDQQVTLERGRGD